MRNNETALPPPKVLHGTLRKVTERLACELARPTHLTPDWSDFEWQLARAVAAMHGVSPLLASNLKWDAPQGWVTFLQTQRAHVAIRHRRIEELLSQLDIRSRQGELALVGLKGAALHALGLYRAGERPMADIDLLVHPRDTERAGRVLESLGFHEGCSNWKHKVFMPKVSDIHADMGEHADNYIKIELHERLAEIMPLRTTEVTESVWPRRAHPGLNAYPSNAALMAHLLIHAGSAMAFRALRLLHLHDIALVSSRMSRPDWDELLTQGASTGGPWWALPPLQLTARYYDVSVPTHVLAALAGHCHWTLRRIARHQSLSDVSFSYLWIEAFPGIGWSRSAAEMMEYVARRIRPGNEMLRQRKLMLETEPPVAHSQWGRLSQGQRMLRWVMSRQARADTMHAVRTALAQPQ
jgi:hypothetical protein